MSNTSARRSGPAGLGIVAAGIVSLTACLAACGSGGKGSAPTTASTTTARATSTTTAPPPGAAVSALAARADALCGQIDKAVNDTRHFQLKSPASLGAITSDFSQLQSDANSVANASKRGAHRNQLADVVAAVRQALGAGKGAANALASANVGVARADIDKVGADLSKARRLAASTDIKGCAAPTHGVRSRS